MTRNLRAKRLSRRTFLRGSIGAGLSTLVALPVLECMLNGNGTALAQGEPLPKRFGVFFFGDGRGVEPEKWAPAGTGAGWQPSLELAPLAALKDYVTVVTKAQTWMPNSGRGHHSGTVGMLSGYDYIEQDPGGAAYRSTFSRPSIDQLAAQVLGVTTPYRSLEVGISRRVVTGEGTTLNFMSHNGPDNVNPPEFDPRTLYGRLFSGDNQGQALDANMQALRASVLDTVLEDLNGLRSQVSAADRTRLDQHAEGIRAVERRLSRAAETAQQCTQVAEPGDFQEVGGVEPLAERTQAMSELLAVALSCDLTRVFTMQFTGSVAQTVFAQLGQTLNHHGLSHEGAAAQAEMEAATVFTMEQLAVLLGALRDTPDGDGNLLDSCAILATSDHGDGALHSLDDMPVVIAGHARGALVHPGIHSIADGEHTNAILLALLRAVGVDIAEIGEQGAYRTESYAPIVA